MDRRRSHLWAPMGSSRAQSLLAAHTHRGAKNFGTQYCRIVERLFHALTLSNCNQNINELFCQCGVLVPTSSILCASATL